VGRRPSRAEEVTATPTRPAVADRRPREAELLRPVLRHSPGAARPVTPRPANHGDGVIRLGSAAEDRSGSTAGSERAYNGATTSPNASDGCRLTKGGCVAAAWWVAR
jgi:hypothetical protein